MAILLWLLVGRTQNLQKVHSGKVPPLLCDEFGRLVKRGAGEGHFAVDFVFAISGHSYTSTWKTRYLPLPVIGYQLQLVNWV